MRQRSFSVLVLLAAGCLLSACDGLRVAIVVSGPSTVILASSDPVRLGSGEIVRHSVPQNACPSDQPFSVPFNLNVTAGESPVTVSEVRMRSVDAQRHESPETVLNSASLTRRFGTVTVASHGARDFSFSHEFGCFVSGAIVLHLAVTTTDGDGAQRVSALEVPVP